MKKILVPLLGAASPVTVIGLCKNAGKTTAMRRLMGELEGECLGLTSVGRDGEQTDLVTGTEKPQLYVKRGDLFATARVMLSLCDVTLEVAALTGVSTPLGEVAVLRALSDGFVQLAGPSAAGQLPPLCRQFAALGAERVLIDGAAGRKSLAWAGTALLCAGASLDRDMNLVTAETAHVCRLFSCKRPESAPLCAALDGCQARFALFRPDGEELELPTDEGGTPAWTKLPREHCVLWIEGGVTDSLLKTLARRGAPLTLAAADATHVLAGRGALEQFTRMGGRIQVRRELSIAAVIANPWSAYGWQFDPEQFGTALRRSAGLPVVDVREEQVWN